jgi:cytoskeletal protein RodZ
MANRYKNRSPQAKKPWIIGAVCLLVVILVVLLGWLHWRHTAPSKPIIIKTTGTTSNKSAGASTTTPSSTSTSTDKTSVNGGAPPPASSNITILQPSGQFVSNHSPNLSGSPAPSSEESVCNGTPGAQCYIQFTNTSDGTVFKLASETLDSNGAAYWQWDVKTNNLEQGSWQVTAFSTLGNQTKSAQDARNLTVGP